MYKQHLLFNLERELLLLKQLSKFIEPKHLDFRPGEKLRSTYELMQYLSNNGSVMMRWFLKNDVTTPEVRAEIAEQRKSLTLDNFAQRIDEQIAAIKRYFEEISDDDLQNKIIEMPSKEKLPLGSAIINGPIKWLTTYRMELFVYIKMNGRTEISTKEAWSLN